MLQVCPSPHHGSCFGEAGRSTRVYIGGQLGWPIRGGGGDFMSSSGDLGVPQSLELLTKPASPTIAAIRPHADSKAASRLSSVFPPPPPPSALGPLPPGARRTPEPQASALGPRRATGGMPPPRRRGTARAAARRRRAGPRRRCRWPPGGRDMAYNGPRKRPEHRMSKSDPKGKPGPPADPSSSMRQSWG